MFNLRSGVTNANGWAKLLQCVGGSRGAIASKRKTVEDMDERNKAHVSNQQSGLITDNQFIFLVINCSDHAQTRTEKKQNNVIFINQGVKHRQAMM